MRADRLIAALLVLQARHRITAPELAAELEVSVRTARRDLEALAMAGVPVYSQAGRGGGWSLIGGARTDLSGLSAPEARALFLVAGPAAATTPELQAALRKLVQALPAPFRDQAAAASGAVRVDPAAWGQQIRPESTPFLEPLQEALLAQERVRLGYRRPEGDHSVREVDPYGLVAKAAIWYLVAGTDAGQRTFRVSRVRSVEPLGVAAQRPADFDLDQAWEQIRVGFARAVASTSAEADVAPWTLTILRRLPRTRLEEFGPVSGDRDGFVSVRLYASDDRQLAGLLAGFGASVRVTGPPEVRARLARIGTELTALYR
ncbi:MAG: YafY family protein [Actinomycetota bacterium]